MIDSILNIIKENVSIFRESSTDLKIRCPYCGDSKKNSRSTHLYISKQPVKQYGTYIYHCFRAECQASGTLYELLSDLGLIGFLNKDQLIYLLSTISNKQYIKKHIQEDIVDIEEIKTFDKSHINKINYIKNRLELDDLPEYITKPLITTFKYLPLNNLKDNLRDYLENSFVGFKTFDGCKIICRNITKSNFRYYNIYLNKKPDYFITSPRLNNFQSLKKGYILLAEGIFSVLKGYLHLQKYDMLNTDNIILVATLGGKPVTFLHAYEYVIHSIGVPDWDVYILSDSEISIDHYKLLKNKCMSQMFVLYNKKDVDFGTQNCEIVINKI